MYQYFDIVLARKFTYSLSEKRDCETYSKCFTAQLLYARYINIIINKNT